MKRRRRQCERVTDDFNLDSPIRLERLFTFVAFCLFLIVYISSPSQQNSSIAYNIPDPECSGVFNLCTDADKERLGRQAIRAIHEQMDDDKDGMIAPSESTDVSRSFS